MKYTKFKVSIRQESIKKLHTVILSLAIIHKTGQIWYTQLYKKLCT